MAEGTRWVVSVSVCLSNAAQAVPGTHPGLDELLEHPTLLLQNGIVKTKDKEGFSSWSFVQALLG